MKKLLSIIAIALIGAFVLSSCNNEYETEPLKTVNVSGEVKADLSMTSAPMSVASAKLIFRIDSKELCAKPAGDGYTHTNLQYEVDVFNGRYSVDLPAIKDDVSVTIIPVAFKANQVQPDNSQKEKVFESNNIPLTIYEGGVFYQDVTYQSVN